ncbi:sulfotransferase ssu-1-like [Parasteatoda tepidariorum]|uniref:sulfotransferase ssu-1-like n=1 Tax=Parasteatoda tepidariorum TaxID=114398 RepID=UPI001C7249D9|nr:sulfotransferase ssu-1-like [Parasteatoda tepidariorum]XP_042902651.1 sulfotransferase ssu-1-like [Parasteatoda tepidariorum]
MNFVSLSDRPSYVMHTSGLILGPGIKIKLYEQALTYIPENDDVFIVTYPKCGTTWTQNILYLAKNNGQPLEMGQNINHYVPHLEDDGKDVVEKLPRPRIIKTHLPFHLIPKNKQAKYIYIARNPKDCCVSFFHHTKGFKRYNFEDGTFDEYFELFLSGKVDSGDYFDNLLSWYEHRNDPNVLFLLYEDMKTDIHSCIRKMGNFLGGSFQQATEDSVILDSIVQHSNFDTMKNTPAMWASERPKHVSPFIRKGKVGDWRNHFSDEQSKRLDQKFDQKLSGTGAEFLWKNYDC